MKNDIMNNLEQEEALRLIATYLGDDATAEERAELEAWIKDSPSNWDYFMKVKNIWHTLDKSIDLEDISTVDALDVVMKQISRKSTVIRLWKYFQTAAAILIIPLILGGLFWERSTHTEKEKESGIYKGSRRKNRCKRPATTHNHGSDIQRAGRLFYDSNVHIPALTNL